MIREAILLLETHQGEKSWPGPADALNSLMLTILSQNTNDNLRDKAYERLRERFPTWEDVLAAPVGTIEKAIKIAGLSHQKAARMQEILFWVKAEFGELSLRAMKDTSTDAALNLLTSRKGIGIKTAAVVLMATMGRDLCPVDTHVHRIAKRLGWVNDGITAEKTFWQLRPHVPAGKGHSLHMNLLQFGRTICHARKPNCGQCFMWNMCVWEGKEGKLVS